jgi:hypothetical protein
LSDVKYGKGELAKALLFHKCIFIRELLFDNTSKFIDILKDITFVKNVPKILYNECNILIRGIYKWKMQM